MSEKSRKRLTIGGLIFAIVCLILLSLKNQVYYPEMQARDAVKSAKAKKNFTYFEGSKKPLVIFYPGALVEPESYGIWAKKVAENGYPVAIAHFPLDFALLSVNRADQIDKKGGYVIGGHSLGGVCAARYAAERKHQKNLKGVFINFLNFKPVVIVVQSAFVLYIFNIKNRLWNFVYFLRNKVL